MERERDARLQSTIKPAPVGEPTSKTPSDKILLEGQVIDARERCAEPMMGNEARWRHVIFGDKPPREGKRPLEATSYIVRLKTTEMATARERVLGLGGDIIAADAAGAAFLVRLEAGEAQALEALSELVECVRPFKPEEKLSAGLAALQGEIPTLSPAGGGEESPIESERGSVDLNILLYPEQGADRAVQRILALGGVARSQVRIGTALRIQASLPPSRVQELAELPEVRLIELDLPFSTQNDHAGSLIGIPLETPFTGEGQCIGHADTGLDIGIGGEALHDDLEGKIVAVFPWGRRASGDQPADWSDPGGHGTHTAATLVGTGSASGQVYRGIAPGALLVHQSLEDAQGQLKAESLEKLFEEAYKAGARVHSNSWSIDVRLNPREGGAYSTDALALDTWAWGGGEPRDMLIVCAAGNAGDKPSTIGSPATAKNCLTVGATESGRQNSNPDSVAQFSSRGPVQGERIKPDLVAPGSWIASARTQAAKVAWSSDLETGPEEIADWNVPSTFTRANGEARSGSHSWHYRRPPGPKFRDNLELPERDLSPGFPLFLQMSLKGLLPPGVRLEPMIQVQSLPWQPLGKAVTSQTFDRWTTKAFRVPFFALGQPVRIAIGVVADRPISEAVDLRIDDLRLTTSNLGWMSELDLARIGDPLEDFYAISSGTSMATPVVAGAAALVREYLEKSAGTKLPSAALVKAILINGADRLEPGPWPNNSVGWGRINLRRSLPQKSRRLLFEQSLELQKGKVGSTFFEVTDASEELRITLVWSDPPGETLVNNLDLSVHPPAGPPQFSFGAPDNHNNVEGLDIPNPLPGLWRVDVDAPTIGLGPQPYALVISGTVRPAPVEVAGRSHVDEIPLTEGEPAERRPQP